MSYLKYPFKRSSKGMFSSFFSIFHPMSAFSNRFPLLPGAAMTRERTCHKINQIHSGSNISGSLLSFTTTNITYVSTTVPHEIYHMEYIQYKYVTCLMHTIPSPSSVL